MHSGKPLCKTVFIANNAVVDTFKLFIGHVFSLLLKIDFFPSYTIS